MKKDEENPEYFAEHNKIMDDSDILPSIEFLENIACEYNSDGTERNFC